LVGLSRCLVVFRFSVRALLLSIYLACCGKTRLLKVSDTGFHNGNALARAYDVDSMKSRTASRLLALGTSLLLIYVATRMAWLSIERLYTAYLFVQGGIPTDDLTAAHINTRLESAVWGIVIGLVLIVSF